ncbi:MAG: insulinase family protein, partial [Phycisphaerales bacterium]|nr:insulinase family protein [Phycisphaerales bacterium]
MLTTLILGASLVSAQPMSRPDHTDNGPNPRTPLPTDDRLTIGELDNGLRYVIRPHANPPGKVGVWIHIGSGSMNETDEQRGLAHFLEHMAFNGSESFPPGEVVKYFESIGLTFGRDQNAFTSFDQTAYQLYLPDTERATLAKGLQFFTDVANRLLLREEDIDEERGIIFEELRTGQGPGQRLRDQWLERLAPGSLIGVRLPIGTEASLAELDREDFLAYYKKWYVASNMTVLVVGDLDPAMAEEEVKIAFNALESAPDPANADAGVTPYSERRAIVAHDPEVTDAQVGLMVVDAPEGPTVD